MTDQKIQRIYLGVEDDEAEVLRTLLAMVPDNPRAIVWVGDERAVDVPEEIAERFTAPAPIKKATKAAKAAPAPPPDTAPPSTDKTEG